MRVTDARSNRTKYGVGPISCTRWSAGGDVKPGGVGKDDGVVNRGLIVGKGCYANANIPVTADAHPLRACGRAGVHPENKPIGRCGGAHVNEAIFGCPVVVMHSHAVAERRIRIDGVGFCAKKQVAGSSAVGVVEHYVPR